MKRAFLAFALAVALVVSLAACSSRPADNNSTSNNGTSTRPVPNNGAAGSDSGIIVDDGPPADGTLPENGSMDEGTTDDAIIAEDTIPPVIPSPGVTRRAGAYYADLNGNLAGWDEDATPGDAARTAADGMVNGLRRAGAAVDSTVPDAG